MLDIFQLICWMAEFLFQVGQPPFFDSEIELIDLFYTIIDCRGWFDCLIETSGYILHTQFFNFLLGLEL